jgi:hypothetical protein
MGMDPASLGDSPFAKFGDGDLIRADATFRRFRDGPPPNNLLNYGYAIVRAGIARSLAGEPFTRRVRSHRGPRVPTSGHRAAHSSLCGSLSTSRLEGRRTSAEEFATAVARALSDANPRTRYRVGRDSRLVNAMSRALPDRLIDRYFAKVVSG